jgi:uncharacterized membrane protein
MTGANKLKRDQRPFWQIAATICACAMIASVAIPLIGVNVFLLFDRNWLHEGPEQQMPVIATVTLNIAGFAFFVTSFATAIAVIIGWFVRPQAISN